MSMCSALRECVYQWDGWGQVQGHLCIAEGMSVNKGGMWLDRVCDGRRWEGEWCCERVLVGASVHEEGPM